MLFINFKLVPQGNLDDHQMQTGHWRGSFGIVLHLDLIV